MFENVRFFLRIYVQIFPKMLKWVFKISSQKILIGLKNADIYADLQFVNAGFKQMFLKSYAKKCLNFS